MTRPTVKIAGEGHLDLAVLKRLALDAGFEPGDEFGRRGKQFINERRKNWNQAAIRRPWIVLCDLDKDYQCPGQLVAKLLPNSARFMCFRVAVAELENWLLADRVGFAGYFGVRAGQIPDASDSIDDPKALLLRLANSSRRREVRDDLVHVNRNGHLSEGDLYNATLSEYALTAWRPREASRQSPSLKRARTRISELADRWKSR